MPKEIEYHLAARRRLKGGVDKLARIVGITLGPCGANVILDKGLGAPAITREGVGVARDLELDDPYENMGVQLLKEAASKTADVAGDGTATATVLAQALIAEGLKAVSAGVTPQALKRGIERATAEAVAWLESVAVGVLDRARIAQVATIASNGDAEVGELLAEAMARVGKDGVVTVEEAAATETSLEVVEGMRFERGFLSPYFATDAERMEAVLDHALILLHDQKIASMRDLLPLLEKAAQAGQPLLIVADDVEGEALATLVVNKLRGTLQVAAVKAPGFGSGRRELMEDLALITGGQLITEDAGRSLAGVALGDLGRARRVTLTAEATTVVGGDGSRRQIDAFADALRQRARTADSDIERDGLAQRLARLVGGIAVIRVGAQTETAMKERKARVEDALNATIAAAAEGIVPGGGTALLRAGDHLRMLDWGGDEAAAVAVVVSALQVPLRIIAENSGAAGVTVVQHVHNLAAHEGYDARTGEYTDLIARGIIDPVRTVRTALQNATSIATLVLTTEALVADVPDEHS
jgi:chaperonin GroEL